MKRIFLFVLTNIAVMITINLVMRVLGLEPYLNAAGLNYQSLAVFCLLWGFVGSFISLLMSKWMAKTAMGVQIVADNGQYHALVNKVYTLAKAAGLPKMPEVGIYESADINAFATGPSKSNSLVAVSTGLLQKMNEDEVDGVLAHEVAHIANGDMVTMALLQGVINAFVMFFARVAAFALQNIMRSNDDESSAASGGWAYYISVMVFEVLFSFLGMFVLAYFSRFREYRADYGAAKLGGRQKMIAALQRLKSNFELGPQAHITDDAKFSAFKISPTKNGIMQFLSTHPSLDQRIAALERGY